MNMRSYSCCSSSSIQSRNISNLSSLLKLVAAESRLQLLCILRRGEHCVCDLEEHVNLSQSLISHHLKDLKEASILMDEKRGLRVYYSLTDHGKHVTDLLLRIWGTEVENL